jgi:hypothetical protein
LNYHPGRLDYDPAVTDRTVALLSKRRERGRFAQQVQHGLPAVVLLFNGLRRIGEEPAGWSLVLAVVEVTAALLVIAAFWQQLRSLRHESSASAAEHHGVDRIDLLLGLMLTVEVWAHWYETDHVRRPTVLLAATMIALGLFHGRLMARVRRVIRVGDSGLSIGLKFFRRFDSAWSELAGIDVGPRYARIIGKDGRTCSLDLDDLRNGSDVRAALADAQERLSTAVERARVDPVPTRPAVSGP